MPGVLLILASGGKARVYEGVCEASGGWAGKLPEIRLPFAGSVSAITFGHIVLAACEQSLLTTHTHERAHVCQYERWGVLFFPAYALAGFGAWLRGKDPYRDNPFEIAARAAELTDRSDE